MRLRFQNVHENPVTLLRRAGYHFQYKDNGEMSFIRPLSKQGDYPRFHAYARMTKTTMELSLHLDHKEHTYGETTRHHGEYADDGPVGTEAERLSAILKHDESEMETDTREW